MRCVLTGATGYIGSNLCRRLSEEGWEVAAIIRPSSDTSAIAGLKKVSLFAPLEPEDYAALFRYFSPQTVFHLAASGGMNHRLEDIPAMTQSNILLPTLLLETMALCGAKNFVNIGSFWQNPYSKDYHPICLYAATKEAFSKILTYYQLSHGINAVTLKLFDTYGPNDPRPKIINLLRKAALSGERLSMSPGFQYLDLVYIDDVTDAILTANELLSGGTFSGIAPCEFSVCGGSPATLREIAALIEEETGIKLNLGWGELPYRTNEVMRPRTGGTQLPGWRPKTDLKTGIKALNWADK